MGGMDTLARRAICECLGTAFLLMVVVGSGIMGDRLSGGNVAIALLANTIATGAGLTALILTLGSISGAHLNPLVTLVSAFRRDLLWHEVASYCAAQTFGAALGVAFAHAMFELPLYTLSTHVRTGNAQWLSEAIASFGLLLVILGCSRSKPASVPFAVGLYITSAYWFTSSTSFANPAVTLARALTNSFSGIRPADVPGFLVAQLVGAGLALGCFRALFESKDEAPK
jgi:glycerol uptake facilitator-like aquaporin